MTTVTCFENSFFFLFNTKIKFISILESHSFVALDASKLEYASKDACSSE